MRHPPIPSNSLGDEEELYTESLTTHFVDDVSGKHRRHGSSSSSFLVG